MEFILIWTILSIVAGVIADKKGRSGVGFFFLSIILSPLVGIIVALVVKENRFIVEKRQIDSGEGKRCPYCAEIIKIQATVCRYCGKELSEASAQEIPPPEEIRKAIEKIKYR